MTTKLKGGLLSAFSLKIIACVTMFLDHLGVALFPEILAFRIIGRLAFPFFAYFIAEGCYYTKNRLKRFLSVFVLSVICETVYIIYDGQFYGNILITFSFSILLIYALDELKHSIFLRNIGRIALFSFALVFILTLTYITDKTLGIDYGFEGTLPPLLASFCYYKEGRHPRYFKRVDNKITRLVLFALGLVLVSLRESAMYIQIFSLFALIPLALYNGKIGKYKLKYFFYLFYPLHLLLIEGITTFIK